MASKPAKRQRANTQGDSTAPTPPVPAVPQHDLNVAISSLDTDSLRSILLQWAQTNPPLANAIRLKYEKSLQVEASKVINFDHMSGQIWKDMNVTYKSMNGSMQYHFGGEVANSAAATMKSIQSRVCEASSWATKRSALETLRKIGKTITLSGNSTLGSEVHKYFQYDTSLDDAFRHCVDCLTLAQRAKMCSVNDGRGPFIEKLEELAELSSEHSLFEDLPAIITELKGDEEDETNSEDKNGNDTQSDDDTESGGEDEDENSDEEHWYDEEV